MKSDKTISKTKRFSVGTRTGENIARSLAPSSHDEGGFELIALDRIAPDPQNPRRLGLSLPDIRKIDPADPLRERKQASLEDLEDMALTIKEAGVLTPIRVYRAGQGFRIAHGERRYLASVLAGAETIPAIILKERPASLRLEQYIENASRVDLSLPERLQNLAVILDESDKLGRPLASGDELRDKVGLSRTQAYRYWTVLQGPKDVWEAIQKETLLSVKDAAEIARISDPVLRNRAIKQGTATPEPEKASKAPAPAGRGRGRPSVIRLGTTPRVDVIQRIVEAVAGAGVLDIDWTDPAAVSKGFKAFLKSMEDGKL